MDYQVIVIGAGPGGYVAAIECAKQGLSTAVIEARDVGGTCLNRGCIPTKALLHSAEVYTTAKGGENCGVTAENVSFDFAKMHARKQEVVEKMRAGVESLFTGNKITLIRGKAELQADKSVKVTAADGSASTYTADSVILAAGSIPAKPPIPGLTLPGVITSDELLEQTTELAKSIVIIGGGVIGVEIASVYAALGCEVTIVEALDRLLAIMDKDISQNIAMILKKRGVKVCTSAMVKEIVEAEGGLTVKFEQKGKEGEVTAETVLCAIGRRPNTAGLVAEGVALETERGRVVVNEKFETSIPGVYAIGDVSSKVQLAHTASAQGIMLGKQLGGKEDEDAITLNVIPSCIYTSPEIASVGITEAEAAEQGIAVKVGKYMMHGNGKTLIAEGERGFIKIVADAESDVVLGAQLMCERATDMLSELSVAVVNKLTVAQLLAAIRPHPTFNEAVTEALELTRGGSIHSMPARR